MWMKVHYNCLQHPSSGKAQWPIGEKIDMKIDFLTETSEYPVKGVGNQSHGGQGVGKPLGQEVYEGRLVCSDLSPAWPNILEAN